MKKRYLKFASYKAPNDIFDAVKSGEKTIETRPANPGSPRNPADFKPGDILVLKALDTGEVVEKKITFVHAYPSVEQMAKSEPVDKIFPEITKPEELIEIYEEVKKKWGKSYSEKLEKHGIVAIGIE